MKKFNYQNRRRNYFIKKEFQTRFILKFCILVVLTTLISASVLYHFSSQSVTTVFEDSRLTIKPSTEFIVPGLILSTLISVIIVGVATVAVVLFISHRIAGPLYKLEDSLEQVANGDVSFDIRLRKGDETEKLAEAFNATSRGLDNLISGVKEESAQLDSAITGLKTMIAQLPAEQQGNLKKAIEELEAGGDRLNMKLNKFKLR